MYPPMAAAVEYCREVERQDWDFIQFADQLQSTHPTGMLPDPDVMSTAGAMGAYGDCWFGSFEMMSAASVVTRDIEIHLSAIDPLRRSPAVFAQEAATVSHLSGGRARFHIAQGEGKQFQPYGEKQNKPLTRMIEAIRVMRALYEAGNEPTSRDSEFWPLTNAVFPIPLYEGKQPPFFIVGGGPKVEELTGKLGAGWSTFLPGGVANDVDTLADTIGRIKGRAAAHGRDPEELEFFAMVFVVIAENDDDAWKLARHPVPSWMTIAAASINSGETWKQWGYEHPLGDFAWPKDASATTFPADLANSLAEKIPDEVTDRSLVWGDPERVAARCQPYVDAGVTHLSFWNYTACADPATAATFPELMSQVVEPLRGRPLTVKTTLHA
jgi:phthiodiolone/phenolphthiodiolone dimycocerosates ketoreductase